MVIKENLLKKRKFYNNRDYYLDEQRQVLVLNENFHNKLIEKKLWGKFGFKKIGGSSIGDVLETDKFKSGFKAFARIARLDMPILDETYIYAGVVIEPMVLNLLATQPAVKEVEHFDAITYNYDYFPNVPIFGGLPDGLVKPQNIVVEIKTTGFKNYDYWLKNGPPVSYLKQAQLYTFLMNLTHFAIVVTFLHEGDYDQPHNYDISKRITRTFPYILDRNAILDDIAFAKKWYQQYTKAGISPPYNLSRDGDLVDYLKCKNVFEYRHLLDKWDLMGKIK